MVSSVVLNFLGWYYVPNFATKYALQFFHQFYYVNFLHTPPPQPGTLAYRNHYRYTYAVVVLGYLIYNLVQGASSMPANFYEVLGVYSDVDDAGLRIAFRQFAKRNHPDRVGVEGEAHFIAVRDVYDSLKNPVVRFAYDRFGPDVLGWSNMSTPKEYLQHGLIISSGYHVAAFFFLLVWSNIGRRSPVKFWRYMLYLTLLASELALVVYPSPSSSASIFASGNILHSLFPRRVSFQHTIFLHQLFMFLTTALTNVAPVLFVNDQPTDSDLVLQRLNVLTGVADREASVLLHTELQSIQPYTLDTRVPMSQIRPILEPGDVIEQLTSEIEEMIIERQLMSEEGPLKTAWEGVVASNRMAGELNTFSGNETLPSPISPLPKADGVLDVRTRLPSPRPSPPPQLHRKGSSYVRARSISY